MIFPLCLLTFAVDLPTVAIVPIARWSSNHAIPMVAPVDTAPLASLCQATMESGMTQKISRGAAMIGQECWIFSQQNPRNKTKAGLVEHPLMANGPTYGRAKWLIMVTWCLLLMVNQGLWIVDSALIMLNCMAIGGSIIYVRNNSRDDHSATKKNWDELILVTVILRYTLLLETNSLTLPGWPVWKSWLWQGLALLVSRIVMLLKQQKLVDGYNL